MLYKDGSLSDGIPVHYMSEMFKILDNNGYKTLESMGRGDFLLTEGNIISEDSKIEVFQGKKIQFAKINAGDFLTVKLGSKEVFLLLQPSGVLKVSDKKEDLVLKDKKNKFKNDEEKLSVMNWLETGETGLSSLTLCLTLYPFVKNIEYKCFEDFDKSYPRDSADFGRCIKFLNAVPTAREKLHKLEKSNKIWKELYSSWADLEFLYVNKDFEELNKSLKSIAVKNKSCRLK